MNIVGRLTRDAKVSTLESGKRVVNFSVAVNEQYLNKQGERVELTEYFDCAFGFRRVSQVSSPKAHW